MKWMRWMVLPSDGLRQIPMQFWWLARCCLGAGRALSWRNARRRLICYLQYRRIWLIQHGETCRRSAVFNRSAHSAGPTRKSGVWMCVLRLACLVWFFLFLAFFLSFFLVYLPLSLSFLNTAGGATPFVPRLLVGRTYGGSVGRKIPENARKCQKHASQDE